MSSLHIAEEIQTSVVNNKINKNNSMNEKMMPDAEIDAIKKRSHVKINASKWVAADYTYNYY